MKSVLVCHKQKSPQEKKILFFFFDDPQNAICDTFSSLTVASNNQRPECTAITGDKYLGDTKKACFSSNYRTNMRVICSESFVFKAASQPSVPLTQVPGSTDTDTATPGPWFWLWLLIFCCRCYWGWPLCIALRMQLLSSIVTKICEKGTPEKCSLSVSISAIVFWTTKSYRIPILSSWHIGSLRFTTESVQKLTKLKKELSLGGNFLVSKCFVLLHTKKTCAVLSLNKKATNILKAKTSSLRVTGSGYHRSQKCQAGEHEFGVFLQTWRPKPPPLNPLSAIFQHKLLKFTWDQKRLLFLFFCLFPSQVHRRWTYQGLRI